MNMRISYRLFLIPLIGFLAFPGIVSAQTPPYQSVYYVDGSKTPETYRSTNSIEALNRDQNAVMVDNGALLSMTWMRIHKTAGTASVDSKTYPGLNAAVLSINGSKIEMDNCSVSSHSGQSDVVSSVGKGSRLMVTKGTYQSSRTNSPVMAAYSGGAVQVEGVNASSGDSHSPLIYSIGDGSSVTVNGVKGHTAGIVSPVFRGSGAIIASDCRISSNASNYVTIEESGNIMLADCNLLDAVDGAILAMNMQGVPSAKPSRLDIQESSITVKKGDLINAVNCNSEIVLQKNKISIPKDGAFIRAIDNDFGEKGKNGGHVKVSLLKQAVTGNVIVNDISSAVIELGKGSTMKGAVNPEGKGGRVEIFLAKGAVWASKSASNITVIRFEQPVEKGVKQIKSKGDIVYDAADPANAPLGGREFKLAGGGILRPAR